MTVQEHIEKRRAEGVSLSAAVRELAAITGAGVRSVWRWVDGGEVPPYARRWVDGGEVPPYARRLLVVWQECSDEQRSRWFEL